jgi:CheY-like chemotaxis protein
LEGFGLQVRLSQTYYFHQLIDRTAFGGKKVLLIDRLQATREARTAVLRSQGVEVHEAEELSTARFLWQPSVYDLVMLAVRRYYSPEDAVEFYEQIKGASPRQRIVFLTGSSKYLSRTWPGNNAAGSTSRGQWGETVKCFLVAA